MFYIILAIIVVSVLFVILTYNRLIAQIEAVNNNNKQIDIQLDRRFKVFESLIESVKKYMDYEKTTLKDVIALRGQAVAARAAGNTAEQFAAENKISTIASGLNLVFEQYPDLKANQNVMQLQEEIISTENKLAFAKQSYNDSIEIFNANKKSFPTNVVVGVFASALDKNFVYWQLSTEQLAQKEEYKVKF